ncbi:uncharacterized protein LAJ45_04667 [Morchella importuna]|uniref:Uncharacterized protein n=1 Tax=Morchella conica CCBAS932 TaxID=1392247 RepID=A0A3N4KRX4_9PEZI|nr:uncharacterized protein LAJ45_04667 [Morchella importuna]KAH8151462.1 hypothetical protein LAJ45_04667 [Morchella importuna]RPB08515.1 hypothetical protein P167DRAFT_578205 [Morchella conica CCBAS932]
MEDQNQAYGQMNATNNSASGAEHTNQSQPQKIEDQERPEGRLSTTQEQPERVRSHLANLPPSASTNTHHARFSNAKSLDSAPSTTPPPTEWEKYFEARSSRIRKERERKAASTQRGPGSYWHELLQEYRDIPPLHEETEEDRLQSEIMSRKKRDLMESRSNGSGKRFRFWER